MSPSPKNPNPILFDLSVRIGGLSPFSDPWIRTLLSKMGQGGMLDPSEKREYFFACSECGPGDRGSVPAPHAPEQLTRVYMRPPPRSLIPAISLTCGIGPSLGLSRPLPRGTPSLRENPAIETIAVNSSARGWGLGGGPSAKLGGLSSLTLAHRPLSRRSKGQTRERRQSPSAKSTATDCAKRYRPKFPALPRKDQSASGWTEVDPVGNGPQSHNAPSTSSSKVPPKGLSDPHPRGISLALNRGMATQSGFLRAWFLVLLIGAPAWAAPPSTLECECRAYVDSAQVLQLSPEIKEILVRTPILDPASVQSQTTRIESIRDQVFSDASIPSQCKEWVARELGAGRENWTILARQRVLGNQEHTPNLNSPKDVGENLTAAYLLFAGGTLPCESALGPLDSHNPAHQRCISQLKTHRIRSLNLNMGASPARIYTALQNVWPGFFAPRDAHIVKVFHQILQAPDFEQALQQIPTLTASLDNNQYIQLVAMMGAFSLMGYDSERGRFEEQAAEGIVQEGDIFSAIKSNISTRSYDNPGTQVSAGVCRDISYLQGKMLEKRGFKNTYLLGYSSAEGGHMTVVTQDPKDPRRVIKINYGNVTESFNQDGAKALFQGSSGAITDLSQSYLLHDTQGRTVAYVPSELAKTLLEISGMDPRSYDPAARQTSSLISLQKRISSSGILDGMKARVAYAQDGVGANTLAASADTDWNTKGSRPGRVALTLAHRQIEAGVPNTHNVTENQQSLIAFAAFEQTAQKKWNPKEKLTLKTGATLQGHAAFHHQLGKVNSGVGGFGSLRPFVQSQLELGKEFQVQAEISSNVSAGLVDTRDQSVNPGNVQLYASDITAMIQGLYQKDEAFAAYIRAMLTRSALGTRGLAEVGAKYRDFRALVQLSGALPGSDPAVNLLESSKPRLAIGADYQLNPHLSLGLIFRVRMDDPTEASESHRGIDIFTQEHGQEPTYVGTLSAKGSF